MEVDTSQLEKTQKNIWAGACAKQLYRLEESNVLMHDPNLIPLPMTHWPTDLWACIYRIEVKYHIEIEVKNTVCDAAHLSVIKF